MPCTSKKACNGKITGFSEIRKTKLMTKISH